MHGDAHFLVRSQRRRFRHTKVSTTMRPATLHGQNGGTGWGSSWNYAANGTATIVSQGLNYTDANGNILQTSGRSTVIAGGGGRFRLDLSRFQSTNMEWALFGLASPRPTIGATRQSSRQHLGCASSVQLHTGTGTTADERVSVGKPSDATVSSWELFSNGSNDSCKLKRMPRPLQSQTWPSS